MYYLWLGLGFHGSFKLPLNHAMHQLQVELKADGTTLQQAACSQAKLTCRNFLPIANVNLLQGAVISASGDQTSLQATGDKATLFCLRKLRATSSCKCS